MSRFKLLFIFVVLLGVNIVVKAQGRGYDYLGIWRTISPGPDQIDEANNLLKFTIDVPPEDIDHSASFKVYGPSVVFVGNFLGNTFDLWLDYREVLLESSATNHVVVYEFPVKKWVDRWGNAVSEYTSGAMRCFYYLELRLNGL